MASSNNAATVGFESDLWYAAEFKDVILGLLLLQYITNAPGIGCVKGLCHIVE